MYMVLIVFDYSFYICSSRQKSHRPALDTAGRLQLQKFVYEDGYIAVEVDRNLVLATPSGGSGVAVVLARRRVDDITQKWVIKENGSAI